VHAYCPNRAAILSPIDASAVAASVTEGAEGEGSTVQNTDLLYTKAYIDVDEWRDEPERHRYVHGGLLIRRW
jgi:hypothetical protein